MEIVDPIKNKENIEKISEELLNTSKRNYLIFMLGINTGLRVSDILGLNVESVKGKDRVFLREKKTGKSKQFPLNDKLRKLLDNFIEEEKLELSDPLFLGDKGSRMCRSIVYRFLNDACQKCDINLPIGTHTMRKTFGYHFYKKYRDVAMLQKIFNHSSPDITLRYIGIAQDEMDECYMNFEL